MFLRRAALGALLALVAGLLSVTASSAAWRAPEPYAGYVPQRYCMPQAKPGTVLLGKFLVRRYGGKWGGISRPCAFGGHSEHKEGRAFDWTLDARSARDRARAREFLTAIFATDRAGNRHAIARRMGIMYLIWNDRIYSAYNGFRARPYLSSGCRSLATCSATLRHRDHLHISLNWGGARGWTSWYASQRR